jgi:ubiquinone/menaquinone biosynthesis C-methylase UbiE
MLLHFPQQLGAGHFRHVDVREQDINRMRLEDAQRRKHDLIAEQIGIGPGTRLLDLGCGWGPLLAYARERGARGVGVTRFSPRRCSIGKAKAAVLPVPVWAMPRRSRPAKRCGIACAWIGVGRL